MIIPGFVIALLTFPGVIVHEGAHRFFCDIAKVPVYQVCYIRVGNPAGYVIHGNTDSLRKAFLISVGPLIVNTILCAVICFSAVLPLFFLQERAMNIAHYALAYLGLSIGMHAFPSNVDMKSFMAVMHRTNRRGFLFFVAKFFQGLIYVANLLRVAWFDLIYAVAVAVALPLLLTRL